MNHKLSCHRSRLPGKFVRVIVARHTHGWLFDHERKIRMHNSIEIENFALNRDCRAFFGQENPFPTRLLLWSFTLMFWYCWLVQGDISRCELYLHLPIFVFFSIFLISFWHFVFRWFCLRNEFIFVRRTCEFNCLLSTKTYFLIRSEGSYLTLLMSQTLLQVLWHSDKLLIFRMWTSSVEV